MSGEFSFTLKEMAEIGMVEQMDFHSPTSQYGSLTRGVRYVTEATAEAMRKSLEEIQSGRFAREWAKKQKKIAEGKKDPIKSLKDIAYNMHFTKIEKKVREKLMRK